MLLAVDVGNTHITLGVYDNDNLIANWRIATDRQKSADEIGILLFNLFGINGIDPKGIKDVIISSVVPTIMYSLTHAVRKYFNMEAIVVDASTVKSRLRINYDNPREVGADRIVNAIGAIEYYPTPLVIVDFGTATTFCVVNENNEYLGGNILPGIKISMAALFEKTAKLPRVEIQKPRSVIGTNTVDSMQAGVYYGYVGSVEYMIKKIKETLGRDDVTVVATGGLARLISGDATGINHIDSMLTLKGLNVIYKTIKEENKDV